MINIIGAGPAGLHIAYLLAKKSKEVNVFEEHKEIGLPVQCTGITTSHLKKFTEIKREFLVNRLTTARVCSKNNFIDFKLKNENLVIDRKKFDQHLAKKAKQAGANIFLNHKYLGFNNNNIIIKDTKENNLKKIKTSILIGADGPLSKVSELINKKNADFWIGAQAKVKIKAQKDIFEAHLGNISPEFFAWLVPENSNTARIGLATKKKVNTHLKKFLKFKNIKQKDIIEYQGGLIPVYNPKLKLQNKNIFLVGDAAAQVKATTGGGLIPSLASSKILASSIINNKNYEKEFKKNAGKDLRVSLKIRNVLNKFSDKDYDYLIKLCENKKIKDIIEKHDREFPSRFLIKLLLDEPRFLYFLKHLLW